MEFLLDANILIRLANRSDPQRDIVLTALEHLHRLGHDTVIVPQVAYEYWVVATRPTAQNGLGVGAQQAASDLVEFSAVHRLLDDIPGILGIWRNLVVSPGVLGKRAHNARLVAAMLRHGVDHLLTFNEQDFSRLAEITACAPQTEATLRPAQP